MHFPSEQFFIFFACLFFGVVSGFPLAIIAFIKYKINNKLLRILPDVFLFVTLGLIFSLYSYFLGFSNFRFFMYFGVLIGLIIGYKTFNLTLAKCIKRLYNITRKKKGRTNDDGIKI